MAISRRKMVKKGLTLTVMVVGAPGLGKSTFINTICKSQKIEDEPWTAPEPDQLESDVSFESVVGEFEEDGVKISTTFIDTPGFCDSLENENHIDSVVKYIEDRYDEVLLEESRIKRNPKFQDNRVHCVLYFINPTGLCLKETDIEFIRRVGIRSNIIPVIAKSDSLSPEEKKQFKKRIMEDIQQYDLPIFYFPCSEEDDEETINENEELRSLLPFALIGSDGSFSVNNKEVRGREYPWGISEVDNPKHCDFQRLYYVLTVSHLQDLKDITHHSLYERYRTEKLVRRESKMSRSQSEEMDDDPADARDEVARQVMMKEEMLKQEQDKLKERELKIQQEIEEKRKQLMQKEESLKEREMRISNPEIASNSAEN